MDRTKKWRKILAMMLAVVMMLQNAQSVMVFADVTNEQIEQRLAGGRTQTEQQQPNQSQVETRANGEEYKTQSQESTDNGNDGVDIGSPETSGATTEAKTSNADVSAKITQSVFPKDISGTTYNFVQMTAEITNNDTENAATGVNIKALLQSSQLSYVTDYGTLTTGAEAYVPDSNNTSDLPEGSADGYDQIIMWNNQTIGAGETVFYQFAAQLNAENLDGVVDAWYIDGTSYNYTWENTEVLNPVQTPEADQEETPSDTTQDSNQDSNQDANQDSTQEATPTPEVTEETTATPTPEVTEETTSEATETPEAEPTQAADDKKAKAAKKKNQQRLLAQRGMGEEDDVQEGETNIPVATADGDIEIPPLVDGMTVCGNGEPIDLSYITSSILKVDGKKIEDWSNITINRDSKVELSISYEYPDSAAEGKPGKPTLTDNIRYYDLPNSSDWEYLNVNGYIHDKQGHQAGFYEIKNNKIYLYYDNRTKDTTGTQGFLEKYPDYIKGTFMLTMEVDKQSTASKSDIDLNFPGITNGHVKINDSDVTAKKSLKTDADNNPLFDENGELEYTITIDPVKQDTKNIVITDKLSKNLKFDAGSFTMSKDGGNYSSIQPTIDETENTATITIGNLNYNEGCIIKYKVKPSENITTATIDNTASWTWDGAGDGPYQSEVENTIKREMLSKTGSDVGDNTISYRIEINKLKATLIPKDSSVESIQLSDNLNPQLLTYLYDAKVVDENGTSIKGVSIRYNPQTGDLSVSGIPDKTYAILTYSVQVKTTAGETGKKDIYNQVKMTGTVPVEDETTTEVRISEHSVTVEGTSGTITIYKKGYYPDKDAQQQLPLKDIEFSLYEINLQPENNKEVDLEGTLHSVKKTNANGEIEFGSEQTNRVKLNTLYYYKETKAPGYVLDSTKHYFVLAADENTRNLINTKCSSIANSVAYYEDGVIIQTPILNKKNPNPVSTDLIVTKNKDGEAAGGYTFSIALENYCAIDGGYSPADNDGKKVEYSIPDSTSDSKGIVSFKNIIFNYEGIYTFAVKEKENVNDSKVIYDDMEYKVIYTVKRDDFGDLMVEKKEVKKGDQTVYTGKDDKNSNCNIVFNNYKAVSLTLTKDTAGKKITLNNGQDFTFELTGKWKDESDYYFGDSNKKIGILSDDKKTLTVKVKVAKGQTQGSLNLSGLPKGVTITVKEVSIPNGWSWSSSDPDGNNKTTSIELSDTNKVTVTNSYSDEGTVTFKVKKSFNDWNANSQFSFKIERCDTNGNTKDVAQNQYLPKQKTVIITGNDTEKIKSFGDFKYTKDDIYYYIISEVIPEDAVNGQFNGITYDQTKTYVKVVVEPNDEGNGQKKITIYQAKFFGNWSKPNDGSLVEASFENSVASTNVTLQLTKKLIHKNLTKDSGFKFKITDITDESNKKVLSDETTIFETDENKIGKINFKINYKSTQLTDENEKTFKYLIEEVIPSEKQGIEYDETRYTVEVTVAKTGDNLNVKSVRYNSKDILPDNDVYVVPVNETGKAANFVNTYKAETTIHFEGTKALENKALKGDDFTFQIKSDSNTDQRFSKNGQSSTTATVKNDKNGTIVFPDMTYTMDDLDKTDNTTGKKYGEFSYTLKELSNDNQGGITYSKHEINATVVVIDEGNGNLSTKVTYGSGYETSKNGTYTLPNETGENVTFKNIYGSNAKIQVQGTKSLANKSFKQDDFSFQIVSEDDTRYTNQNPLTAKNIEPENGIANFVFPELTYTAKNLEGVSEEDGIKTKTFHYTISEIIPSEKNGIVYDGTKINVDVKLTDDGKGNLTAILMKDNQELPKILKDGMPVYTLPKAENKSATFNNTYDVSVSVKLEGTKELLNNKLTTTMPFKFKITGDESDKRFTVNDDTGESKSNTVLVGIDHIGNNDIGTFEFPLMTYTAEDLKDETPTDDGVREKDFTYTIEEDKTGIVPDKDGLYIKDGVTYDNSGYTIKVHLEDNGSGNLTATMKLVTNETETDLSESSKGDYVLYTLPAAVDENATFTNIYDTEGWFEIPAVKYLNGRNFKKGDKFTFIVTKNNVEFDKVTIEPTETDGNEKEIKFKTDVYSLKDVGKTYHYSIREDHENTITGVKDSNRVYEVSVTITDEAKNGQLEVVAVDHRTVTKEDGTKETIEEPFTKATFINEYTADSTVQISAEKNLSPVELKDNAFSFTLTQTDKNGEVLTKTEKDKDDQDVAVPVYTETVKNQGSNVAFKPITYSQKDVGKTYYYTVKEEIPKDIPAGYTYSQSEYRVKVVVSAAEDGDKDNKLKVVKTITKVTDKGNMETEDIIFDNFYKAEGSVNFAAKKEVTGYTKNLPEFKFIITENGKEVATGKNDKNGNIEFSEIKYTYDSSNNSSIGEHTYVISEVQPKSGDNYIYDKGTYQAVINVTDNGDGTLKTELVTDKSSKDFNVGTDGKITLKKSFVNEEVGIGFCKTDVADQNLPGAVLTIYQSNDGKKGKEVTHWTTTDKEYVVTTGLAAGNTYILEETSVPKGYVKADSIVFKINNDSERTIEVINGGQKDKNGNIVMIDKKTGVQILKVDADGKPLAGAKLAIKDSAGNIVESWTSTTSAHSIEGTLAEGSNYVLTEIEAPTGYRKAVDIPFKAEASEKAVVLTMKDAPTKASILKTDESGKALSGAQLVVKDSTGKELDKWTTDGKAHEITGLLTVGETYTLSEVSAPSGYTVAPDQTFKMEDKDVIEVTMVDYQASGSGQITVTKKVTYANGGDFIDLIAQDDTFYVNLFTDAAGKYPYKGALPQAIHLVNASAGSVTFSDLAQGTYYVYETDANGNVINLDQQGMHNGLQFMCTVDGGSNTVKLDLKAGPKEGAVNLENVFFDIPTGYSYKGEININKQVLKGTTQTTTDDTFYAGIFTKGDDGVYNLFTVVTLVQNDTVTVEVPLGGEDGTEPINYYILETDADGNILDLDVFEYEVTGEGTVALSKENLTGNINLVNKIPEETDGKLRVQKTDGNGVGLAGASFRLTDEDGTVVDEWTSEASAHELELESGTYTLTEVQAPTGYTGAGSVTIEVDDDYNFSVNGEIEYSYNNGLLKIVNKVVPGGSTTPGTSGGGGSTPASYSAALSGKVAVKTGDNTPIGAYAAVLVIAALAIAGGIFYKKKRKNDK